jgi:hypothetical protein
VESPFTEDELDDLVEISYDERSKHYTPKQKDWVDREEKRMTYGEGVYAYINGILTYIPASYWGYINHWTLEHGEKPDYREADRRFFVFMEYICFETEVLGITRGKGRRQGATSLGYYWQWWICGREKDKIGGSISYNDEIAQKNFKGMFMRGFREMLTCFLRDFDSAGENFVSFRKKSPTGTKKGVMRKRQGLNSFVDYLSNSVNSYDGGRVSFLLPDETGKYAKMNINTYWSKVSPTLKIGRKKVGFAYMPTTVNPKKLGGENFRQFWNDANQFAVNPNTKEPYGLNTPHKVIRYFVPATEGYVGCIDKFGASVIEDPVEPIMGNDGEWITEGSRSVILRDRAPKKDDQLMEHRRDFPLTELEMFAFEMGVCEFDYDRLYEQLTTLESEPPYLRRVRLIEHNEVTKAVIPNGKDRKKRWVSFMDDDAGNWLILEAPSTPNKFDYFGDVISPRNTHEYAAGVDTFRIGFAEDGSKGTICIFKKSRKVNGVEEGNYPVALYVGRPRLIQFLYDEVIKVCMWYGCKVNFEISAGDFFYGYFYEKHCSNLLYWTPALDPNKPHPKLKPGTESASPFELAAQLEAAKIFFDGNDPVSYNGHCHRVKFPTLIRQAMEYDHSARTPYDEMISLMMALLPVLKPRSFDKPQTKPIKLLPTYKIKKYA